MTLKPRKPWTEKLFDLVKSATSTSILTGDSAIVQIDEDRNRVRKGTLFTASDRRQLASEQTLIILLRINGNATGMRFQITAELELDVQFLEGVTASVPTDATIIPLRARNRITGTANEALIATEVIDDVTLTDDGTKILDVYIPAGEKNAGIGGSGSSDMPFGLNFDTDYAFRVINRATTTNEISMLLTITEQVP